MEESKYLGSPKSEEIIDHYLPNIESNEDENYSTPNESSTIIKSSCESETNQSPLLPSILKQHHTLQKFKEWVRTDVNQRCESWKGYYNNRKQQMIQQFIGGIRDPIKQQLIEESHTFQNLNAIVQRTEELQKKHQELCLTTTMESIPEESHDLTSTVPIPEIKEEIMEPKEDLVNEIKSSESIDQDKNEENKMNPWTVPMCQPEEASITENNIIKEVNDTYNNLFGTEISTSHLWKKIVSLPTFNGNERLEDFLNTISSALESTLLSEDQKVTLIISRLNGAAATAIADTLHSRMTTEEIISSLKYHYGSPQIITFKTIQNRKQKENETFQEYGTKLKEMVLEFFNNERGYDDQYRKQQEKIFFINGLVSPYQEMLRSRILYLHNIEEAIKEAEKIDEARNLIQQQALLSSHQPSSSRNRSYQNSQINNRQYQRSRFSNNRYQQNQKNFNRFNQQQNQRFNNFNSGNRSANQNHFDGRRNQPKRQQPKKNTSNVVKNQPKPDSKSKSTDETVGKP